MFDRVINVPLSHVKITMHRHGDFLFQVYYSYMFNSQSDFELNCQAARLLLNMIPVLQDEDLFQDVVGIPTDQRFNAQNLTIKTLH